MSMTYKSYFESHTESFIYLMVEIKIIPYKYLYKTKCVKFRNVFLWCKIANDKKNSENLNEGL